MGVLLLAMGETPLPDFDLAPLQGFDPTKLNIAGQTDVGRLVLTLAVVFNDVKGLEYLAYQLDCGLKRYKAEHGLGVRGQLNGMISQILRARVGVFREL